MEMKISALYRPTVYSTDPVTTEFVFKIQLPFNLTNKKL